ncbi:hypothetical protein [Haloplasma contractile]|uniref:Membrane lipoprotein n=1 Tax=Haloplasma contractile SSD-17B TaxID=1033810 RepID=U2FQ79_9MOLU|nr:hypothetical protein [Haloplasma contractile]ERJ13199.1 membrane lipoprotein [Haloplasma contractile SSD-17B]
MKKLYTYLFLILLTSTTLFACNVVEDDTDDPRYINILHSIELRNITIPYEEVKDTKLSDIDYLNYTDAFDNLNVYLDSDDQVTYEFDIKNNWDIDTPWPDHYYLTLIATITKDYKEVASYRYDVSVLFESDSLRVDKGYMGIQFDTGYYRINLYDQEGFSISYSKEKGTERHEVYAYYNQMLESLFDEEVNVSYYKDYLSFTFSNNEQKEYRVYKTERYENYDNKEEVEIRYGEDTIYYVSVDREDGYIRLIKNGKFIEQSLLKGYGSSLEYKISNQETLVFELMDEATQYPVLYAYIKKENNSVRSILKTIQKEEYYEYKDENGELIRLDGKDTDEQCKIYLENTVPDKMQIPYGEYGKNLLNEIEPHVYHREFDENGYISYCSRGDIKYKVVVEDNLYKEDDPNAYFLAYYYDEINSYHHVFKKDIVASFAPVNTTIIYNAYDTSGYVNFTMMNDRWLEYSYINYSDNEIKSYIKLPEEKETINLYDSINDKNLSITNFSGYIVVKSEHSKDFNYKIYKESQTMNLYNEYEIEYSIDGTKKVISLNNDQTGVTIISNDTTDTILYTDGLLEKTYTRDSYTYKLSADYNYSSDYVKVTLEKTNSEGTSYTIEKLLAKE